MDIEEVRDAVLNLRFAKALPHDLRNKVAAIVVNVSELRKIDKGQVWIREHEHGADKGYVLVKGNVTIQKAESPLVECGAPELLGEMMQFSPAHERTATVVAGSDCVVLRFFWDEFWKRVAESLPPEEVQTIRTGLEEQAWSHLTG